MFIMKFIGSKGGYMMRECYSYQVASTVYAVGTEQRSLFIEFKTGSDFPETIRVGEKEEYSRCYVMNEAGKTIDTIRFPYVVVKAG